MTTSDERCPRCSRAPTCASRRCSRTSPRPMCRRAPCSTRSGSGSTALRPGEGVGYGWRFRADTPRSIALVPAGYADGLDTRLEGRGSVLIRGHRVPVVGAVSMDMITVDVTGLDDVSPGDEVVILGAQGDESWQRIDAREMASSIGTIPWEIVCRLGTRVERQYS